MSDFFKFDWQKRLGETDISAPSKAVGMWLSTWMQMDGTGAYPSFQTLAKQSGYSVSTVKKSMKELIDTGWIVQVRKGGSPTGGSRMSNKYAAQVPLGREITRSGDDSVGTIRPLGQLNEATRSSDGHKQIRNSSLTEENFLEKEQEPVFLMGTGWIGKRA